MQIMFPYHINALGLTATTSGNSEYVRELIEQVIFTTPGERVKLPDFGCDVMGLIFTAESSEVITAHQALIRGVLQQQLGDLMQVEKVLITIVDSNVKISVEYILLFNQKRGVASFERKELG